MKEPYILPIAILIGGLFTISMMYLAPLDKKSEGQESVIELDNNYLKYRFKHPPHDTLDFRSLDSLIIIRKCCCECD